MKPRQRDARKQAGRPDRDAALFDAINTGRACVAIGAEQDPRAVPNRIKQRERIYAPLFIRSSISPRIAVVPSTTPQPAGHLAHQIRPAASLTS